MWKRSCISALLLVAASAATNPPLPELRMTPSEVQASAFTGGTTGGSGVAGVRSKVLFGDPAQAGFYAMLLSVPAHTTIQAHSHRDDRMAVVVSGDWHFGYGTRFDEKSLKALPAGSIYSEPGGVNHFAQTGAEPVIVEISGYGPTDTRYFDPDNDPSHK